MYKIPFIKPHLPSAEDLANDFKKIQQSNWFSNFGPFENELCRRVSSLYGPEVFVTTIANATLGLQAAVDTIFNKAEPNRIEVIIPSFTFAAGPEILIKSNYKPVFIDINRTSWQPDITEAENYIKDHELSVAGILLCNTFGVGNKEIKQWEALGKKFKLPIIIDSAAGFGSRYLESERVGLRGDCEVFSMHATKPFSVGEGGLVVSKNRVLIDRIREYQNFGFNAIKDIECIGTNAKLQEINCAIGIRQLVDYDKRLESRQNVLKIYKKELKSFGFEFMENDEASSVCFASVLIPLGKAKNKILDDLHSKGIEARSYYAPIHQQKFIMEFCKNASNLPNTNYVGERIISLPVYDFMDEKVTQMIIATLIDIIRKD